MTRPTKEQVQQAVKDSVAHWERMIAWARAQEPDSSYSSYEMQDDIGESPTGSFCALCEVCYDSTTEDETSCEGCPCPRCDDFESPWKTARHSPTYKEFVVNATEMKCVLESLLEE